MVFCRLAEDALTTSASTGEASRRLLTLTRTRLGFETPSVSKLAIVSQSVPFVPFELLSQAEGPRESQAFMSGTALEVLDFGCSRCVSGIESEFLWNSQVDSCGRDKLVELNG